MVLGWVKIKKSECWTSHQEILRGLLKLRTCGTGKKERKNDDENYKKDNNGDSWGFWVVFMMMGKFLRTGEAGGMLLWPSKTIMAFSGWWPLLARWEHSEAKRLLLLLHLLHISLTPPIFSLHILTFYWLSQITWKSENRVDSTDFDYVWLTKSSISCERLIKEEFSWYQRPK